MNEFIQVVTTAARREDAQRIAELAVRGRLAACAQVLGPIASTYRWEGKVETAEEWMCILKSLRARYGELERLIRENHPYEQPEILAVPVVEGSLGYLEWLRAELA